MTFGQLSCGAIAATFNEIWMEVSARATSLGLWAQYKLSVALTSVTVIRTRVRIEWFY